MGFRLYKDSPAFPGFVSGEAGDFSIASIVSLVLYLHDKKK